MNPYKVYIIHKYTPTYRRPTYVIVCTTTCISEQNEVDLMLWLQALLVYFMTTQEVPDQILFRVRKIFNYGLQICVSIETTQGLVYLALVLFLGP